MKNKKPEGKSPSGFFIQFNIIFDNHLQNANQYC